MRKRVVYFPINLFQPPLFLPFQHLFNSPQRAGANLYPAFVCFVQMVLDMFAVWDRNIHYSVVEDSKGRISFCKERKRSTRLDSTRLSRLHLSCWRFFFFWRKKLDSLEALEVSGWPCDIAGFLICSRGASGQRVAEESSLQHMNLRQSSGWETAQCEEGTVLRGKPAENTRTLQRVMTSCPNTHTHSTKHAWTHTIYPGRVTYIHTCAYVWINVWQQCPLLSSSFYLCVCVKLCNGT